MNIKTIASSSAGCCYIVEAGGYQLLIECGVPVDMIKNAFDYNMTNCVGCLISHEHGDHAKYSDKFHDGTWIPIWCTRGTKNRYNISASIIEHKVKFYPGSKFIVTPLVLKHDVECYGFLIEFKSQKLFYVSDTVEVKYKILGLNYLMIETNHSFEKMIDTGRNKYAVARAFENHLSIDSAIEFIKNHPDLKEIHLLHLSGDHADAEDFREQIRDLTGIPVYIPKKKT